MLALLLQLVAPPVADLGLQLLAAPLVDLGVPLELILAASLLQLINRIDLSLHSLQILVHAQTLQAEIDSLLKWYFVSSLTYLHLDLRELQLTLGSLCKAQRFRGPQ